MPAHPNLGRGVQHARVVVAEQLHQVGARHRLPRFHRERGSVDQPAIRYSVTLPGVDTTDIAFAGAAEQARMLVAGSITAPALLELYLDRIARVDVIDILHALDHAAAGHIQARDNPFRQHYFSSPWPLAPQVEIWRT